MRLHPTAQLEVGALALYRSEAAIISAISHEKKQIKLQIQTENGRKISVRPKDLQLLSARIPGNAGSTQLRELTRRLSRDELESGWKLLLEMGSRCSLVDLAEAVFSGSGPCELYNAFCLINQTPYFKGRPAQIMVRSAKEVRKEMERKQRKQEEVERWQRFHQHYQESRYSDEDLPFIQEIEAIAYGEKQNCRLFREMKLEATPEHAHEWLLRQKLWNERFNPYLRRNQITEQVPVLTEGQTGSAEQNQMREPWRELLTGYQRVLAQLAETEPDPNGIPSSVLQALELLLTKFCASQQLCYPQLDWQDTAGPGTAQPYQANAWCCGQRRDLTHLRAWAIDDPWSKDPDDAISLEEPEKGADGSTFLWVHIADPASLLPFGSPLAEEAMRRGATVYTPEGTTPMLPRELVQILGLGLQPVSMALSVRLRVPDAAPAADQIQATVEVLELCRSWVRVKRLSYDQVDQLLLADSKQAESCALQRVWQLCQRHEALRRQNASVQFNMYNTKVVAGEQIRVEALPNTPSRDLVAEAMLMAGAAMARFACERQLPIPFLSQAAPKETLPQLDSMANMFAARKAMSPSSVHCEARRHSSIGVPMYTRGSSPLRRYLDLLCHQQLHALLLQGEGQPLRPLNSDELLYCIAQAELQVSRVNQAQRCSQQHWQLLYLRQEGKKRLYKAIVLDIRNQYQNGRGSRQSNACKALCSLPEVGIETVVFCKRPVQLNQELEVKLKNIQLSRLEAHFQRAEDALVEMGEL